MNRNNDMNLFVPLTFEKGGKDKNGNEYYKIKGVASTDEIDEDGEQLDPNGFDLTRFTSNGLINFNHNAERVMGHVVDANVNGNKLEIEGVLYKDADGVENLVKTAQLLEKHGGGRRLGWSIEGKTLSRDKNNPRKVLKAKLTNVALTYCPKNTNTWASIIKGFTDELYIEPEYDIIEKSEPNGGCEKYIIDIINQDNGLRYTVDKNFNIKIEKAITTTSSAKGTIKEDLDGKINNQIDYDKKKKSLSILTKAFVNNEISKEILSKATDLFNKSHKYIDKKPDGKGGYIYTYSLNSDKNTKTKPKEDKSGNIIGDGSFHEKHYVIDLEKYPQIQVSVNESATTESVYVNYENNNNGKKITVRFSNHENNAVKFGDQLGGMASDNEILFRLGLKDRVFTPKTRLFISSRQVAKAKLNEYIEADKTIQEIYDLGKDADILKYKGMLAKNSNILILGDKIDEIEEQRLGAFGKWVTIGDFTYKDKDS